MNNVLSSSRIIFFIILVIIIAWFFYAFGRTFLTKDGQENVSSQISVPKREVFIGFWTYGLWDDKEQRIRPDRLQDLESKINKKVAIAHYFRGWHHLSEPSLADGLNILIDAGWRPMLSANPYFFEECKANSLTLYKAISQGNCDDFIRNSAINLKSVKAPFFFRFAWEMNVSTMEWSIVYSGSNPDDFKLAWQRIHNIFKEEGVTNAIWVFSPQVDTPSTTPIIQLYPGAEYVDWVGLDGYNWGSTRSWSNWQSFSSVFMNSYQLFKKIAPEKPLMIAEVNTVDKGGDRGNWYLTMLQDEIPHKFLDIDAVVFFNEDKTKQEGINWLIDSSNQSLEKFKKGIQLDIYKSRFDQ